MEKELREGVYIKGFDHKQDAYAFKDNLKNGKVQYIGVTYDIPKHLASKLCESQYNRGHIAYPNYNLDDKPYAFLDSIAAIISACNMEYCVIYEITESSKLMLQFESNNDGITIHGAGKFRDEPIYLPRAEAGLLFIELWNMFMSNGEISIRK